MLSCDYIRFPCDTSPLGILPLLSHPRFLSAISPHSKVSLAFGIPASDLCCAQPPPPTSHRHRHRHVYSKVTLHPTPFAHFAPPYIYLASDWLASLFFWGQFWAFIYSVILVSCVLRLALAPPRPPLATPLPLTLLSPLSVSRLC